MSRGDLVVVAGRLVVVDEVRPDGSKVKINGHWLVARSVQPAPAHVIAAARRREDARWRRLEREVARLVRLVERAERGRI